MPVSERPDRADQRPGPVDRGQGGIWLTAVATAAVLALLAVLVAVVTVNAVGWFWPAPVSELTLVDGRVVIGIELASALSRHAVGEGERQLQLKVGNRELSGEDFAWISAQDVVSRRQPEDLVRVVRAEYGDAFGRIRALVMADGQEVEPVSADTVAALLATGDALRRRQEEVERDLEAARRPLTRREEELDLLERSDLAASAEGQAKVAALAAEVERVAGQLAPRLVVVEEQLAQVRAALLAARVRVATSSDELDLPLATVLDVVWVNRMSTTARVLHAVREAARFLVTDPREANTEGGIYPALFGTVLLVVLMSLAVVPLGVVTAVYMTEYARDGVLLRLANQAVHNLAGVPSIVFGMFGLAFFVYGVGGGVDRLFFADRLPTPTFGTGGILWASLTLALLTVPVVVVATRESLLAVPRSWREGSLALGATRWQTLRTIILPAAAPGILTGFILAVGRAAGEVAPLMLTGAAKLAPSLPVDGSAPFVHLQRKFMHLGFHIYDVSMQSPNVEAAKPMAFATTLVLLALVIAMNLAAVLTRRRLRRAYQGQAV